MIVNEPDYDAIINRFRRERHRIEAWRAYVETAMKQDSVITSVLRPAIIKARIKDETSLRDKIRRKYKPFTRVITPHNLLHEIEDLAGVRLVVVQKRHIPMAIERIRLLPLIRVRAEIHYVWHPDEIAQVQGEGLIAQTKDSGYCSRHIIVCPPVDDIESPEFVTCEVQVRTLLEEAMFENDHRIRYKNRLSIEGSNQLTRIAEILETTDQMIADAYLHADTKSNSSVTQSGK